MIVFNQFSIALIQTLIGISGLSWYGRAKKVYEHATHDPLASEFNSGLFYQCRHEDYRGGFKLDRQDKAAMFTRGEFLDKANQADDRVNTYGNLYSMYKAMRDLVVVGMSINADCSSDQGRELLGAKLKFFAAALRYNPDIDLSLHSSDKGIVQAQLAETDDTPSGLSRKFTSIDSSQAYSNTFEATANSYIRNRDRLSKKDIGLNEASPEEWLYFEEQAQTFCSKLLMTGAEIYKAGLTALVKQLYRSVKGRLFSLVVGAALPVAQVFMPALIFATVSAVLAR